MEELVPLLREFLRRREPAALASVVHVTGSSYRQPGARRLVFSDARALGAITGGCLEDEIDALATSVLSSGRARVETFDLLPRFGCSGTITVLVEKLVPDSEFFARAALELERRGNWSAVSVFAGDPTGWGTQTCEDGDFVPDGFLQQFLPPLRVLLFGDGPENPPLRTIATALGWEVLEFESAHTEPEIDARTAVVVKARKFGRDLVALARLLQLDVPYVGLLGPARRRRQLLNSLVEEGCLKPGTSLAHLYGPAGLDLGGESPAEIALSIVAEIQAVFASVRAEHLRAKSGSIHARGVAVEAA